MGVCGCTKREETPSNVKVYRIYPRVAWGELYSMNAECAGHEKDKNWGPRSDSVRPQDFLGEVEWEGKLPGLGGWL